MNYNDTSDGRGPEDEPIVIDSTIEPAGDYVKYENKKFFQDVHKYPTLEAETYRGASRNDESFTDVKSKYRTLVLDDLNQVTFVEKKKDESSMHYHRMHDQVISKLNTLNLVKPNKRIKTNTNTDKNLGKPQNPTSTRQLEKEELQQCSRRLPNNEADQLCTSPASNITDKNETVTKKNGRPEIQREMSKGFFSGLVKSLTDMLVRPFKKIEKQDGGPSKG